MQITIFRNNDKGEYLLYSKHSPGGQNAIKGGDLPLQQIFLWGKFCYIAFVPWGKICYIPNIPGECLLYSKTTGGGKFCKGEGLLYTTGLVECCPYYIHVLTKPMYTLLTLLDTCTPNTNVYLVIRTKMMKEGVICLLKVLFCCKYWNICQGLLLL